MAVVVEPAGATTEALVLLVGDVVGARAKRVQVEDEPLAHNRGPLSSDFLDDGGWRSGELRCDPPVVDFGMCAFFIYDLAEQVAASGLGVNTDEAANRQPDVPCPCSSRRNPLRRELGCDETASPQVIVEVDRVPQVGEMQWTAALASNLDQELLEFGASAGAERARAAAQLRRGR